MLSLIALMLAPPAVASDASFELVRIFPAGHTDFDVFKKDCEERAEDAQDRYLDWIERERIPAARAVRFMGDARRTRGLERSGWDASLSCTLLIVGIPEGLTIYPVPLEKRKGRRSPLLCQVDAASFMERSNALETGIESWTTATFRRVCRATGIAMGVSEE